MDLELLRTFLELNRSRHFGRTADALFVTQAAVSSRIRSLENQLGVRLFERSRRRIRLTPEGARLVRHAEKMVAAWRAARQDVSMAGAGEQLVLGGSLRLWDVMLQGWLHGLRRTHPQVAVIAEAQTTDVLIRRLIDGTLDVAIVLEPAQIDSLDIREIAGIDLICVSTEPETGIGQALETDYVFVDWGLSFGLDHRRAFPDAPEATLRVSNARIALDYIRSMGGSAYLPLRMIRSELDDGRLTRVQDAPEFRRQAYATYPVRSPKMPLLETALALFD